MKYLLQLVLLFLFSLQLWSCNRMALLELIKPPKPFAKTKQPVAVDYTTAAAWHKPTFEVSSKAVDCFFIHPTTYIFGKSWNQDLTNVQVNWRTQVLPIRYQVPAFLASCNVYIPKYRQAVLYAFKVIESTGNKALELAYKDIRTAFYTFIKQFNKEHPFILAAHSQGAFHGQRLLAEIMQDSSLRERLIVAYLPGWPIQNSFLKAQQIPVCSTAQQTSCVVSWNTESASNKFSLVEQFSPNNLVVCINPLSWTSDTVYVGSRANKGALQPNKTTQRDEIILYYCDAQVKEGILQIHPPNNQRALQMPMGRGNYHLYDYNFFYQNIKINIQERIKNYFKNMGQEYPLK